MFFISSLCRSVNQNNVTANYSLRIVRQEEVMKKGRVRILSMGLAALMAFSIAGCGSSESTTQTTAAAAASETTANEAASGSGTETDETAAPADFKIAIMYTDASQGEEPTRAYEALKEKYGDMVVGSSFPTGEQEVLVSTALGLVSDPDVKALLIFQEPAGSSAAVKACREVRDDVLYLGAVVAEDPDVVEDAFDLIIDPDKLSMGETIVEQAKDMGAENFVHYSFPRHMAMQSLAQRRDKMKETCEKIGVNFVDATAPDPMSDAGVTGTQQFILEDIPKQVESLGENTAFFGTNTAMMDVMVKAVVESKALLPSTCDPSPFQGFTSGLSIEIPDDKANDPQYAIEQIKAKLAELGMSGRLATWPVSSSMLYFESIFEYARQYAAGEISEKSDIDAMTDILDKTADEMAGMDCNVTLKPWESEGKTYSHLVGFNMEFLVL